MQNIELCDRQYNIKHTYKMGLNPSKKKMIEYINSLEELLKLQDKYGDIILSTYYKNNNIRELEIYDDYRE